MKPTPSLRALWLSSITALLASQASAQQSAEKEFETRLAKINQESVDELLELASWAQGKGLKDKARQLFLRVVRKDKDNEEARLALGHVKSGSTWLTAEEADKLRKAGKLEPPKADEKAADNGSAEPVERVAPPKEEAIRTAVKSARDTYAKEMELIKQHYVDEMGVDKEAFNAGRSEHQLVLAKASPLEIENLLAIGEEIYAKLNCLGHLKPDVETFKGAGGPCLAYLIEGSLARETLEFIKKEHPAAIDPGSLKYAQDIFAKGTRGFTSTFTQPMQISARAEENNSLQFHRSAIANGMGHNWLWWNARGCLREGTIGKDKKTGRGDYSLLNWIGEGFGVWASKEAIGTNLYYRVTKTQYGNDSGRADKGKDSDSMYLEFCYEIAVGKAKDAKTFYEVTKQDLNNLDDKALAVAWSTVDYMLRERLEEFRRLIKNTSRMPSFRMAFIDAFGDDAQREQRKKLAADVELDELYRTVCDKFELAWKGWIKSQAEYKIAYDSPGKAKAKPKREFPGDPKDEKGKAPPKKGGKK
jgi:hypothetical protein